MLLPAFHTYVEQGILDTAFVESAELINRKWNVEKDNPAVRLFLDEVRKTTWPCVRILTDR